MRTRKPTTTPKRRSPAAREAAPEPRAEQADAAVAPLAAAEAFPRQRMAATLRSVCAVLRGFEAMRVIQLDAAHQALERHEHMARRLAQPDGPTDLAQLQAELLRDGLQESMRYWQDLAQAVLDMQRELLGGIVEEAEQETREAGSALQHLPEGVAESARQAAEAELPPMLRRIRTAG